MNTLLVLPLALPLTTAAIGLLFWRARRAQRWLGLTGALGLLGSAVALFVSVYQSGIQVTEIGAWPAPYGIVIVADLFSAVMVVVAGVIGLAVIVYSMGSVDPARETFGYHPLLQILLMGVCGAFLTGDIFNLYVWFEVLLVASFVLLALGGEREQIQGAIYYVAVNLLFSAIFLAGIGTLYGVSGTLNFADLAGRIGTDVPPELATVLSTLFLIALGIKSAVFPLFFWLPASYHRPPMAIAAIFAGLLTKVGVYALIRVFTLLFHHEPGFTHMLILVMAGFTMLTGVLGAAAQNDIRRILSFHIISQIGYMIMGLGLAGLFEERELQVLALGGAIFYIVHHIIVKTNLFLIAGLIGRLCGSYDLKDLGGLYRTRPMLALLFLVPALSLAGVPPLSGFFAKLTLIRAGLEGARYVIVTVALIVGLLTLFSMTKIWAEAFWKPMAAGVPAPRSAPFAGYYSMRWPVLLLAGLTLVIGLGGEWFFDVARLAAEQVLDRAGYMAAVLERAS